MRGRQWMYEICFLFLLNAFLEKKKYVTALSVLYRTRWSHLLLFGVYPPTCLIPAIFFECESYLLFLFHKIFRHFRKKKKKNDENAVSIILFDIYYFFHGTFQCFRKLFYFVMNWKAKDNELISRAISVHSACH